LGKQRLEPGDPMMSSQEMQAQGDFGVSLTPGHQALNFLAIDISTELEFGYMAVTVWVTKLWDLTL
jgi:hypothetical protein